MAYSRGLCHLHKSTGSARGTHAFAHKDSYKLRAITNQQLHCCIATRQSQQPPQGIRAVPPGLLPVLAALMYMPAHRADRQWRVSAAYNQLQSLTTTRLI
jgi:hypothetical protein